MEKFEKLQSTAVPLPIEDIDTDQIIPARFLKAVSKDGFGKNLFRDWRYDKNDQPIDDFVLNNNIYKGRILVSGRNFGCGSSREHAAWALADYGFKVVISSYFADIFKSNALNNGILPIKVDDQTLNQIFKHIESKHDCSFEVDLENQTLKNELGLNISFEIDAFKKDCLLKGFDEIDFLLDMKEDIAEFEKTLVSF